MPNATRFDSGTDTDTARDKLSFPDPIVSANLYHAGHLDQVVHDLAIPFWREIRSTIDPDGEGYLWLMRYGVGGEHLKFRIHGPASLEGVVRKRLSAAAAGYLAQLDEPESELVQRGWQGAPPIDVEDAATQRHPDRSFLWTTYRRSHVSLGDKIFLAEDRYAGLVTRCLGAGCDWILDILDSADSPALSMSRRRNSLFKLLITGLAALDFPHPEYLAYHRDWVLRFCFPAESRFEVDYLDDLVRRCDQKTEQLAGKLAPLAAVAKNTWNRPEPIKKQISGTDKAAVWQRALMDLLAYLQPFRTDPAYRTDPFADDTAFAPVFKVFHGAANQLGINLFEEGFTHHLLRAVISDGSAAGEVPDRVSEDV